jgi:hypothetical protein
MMAIRCLRPIGLALLGSVCCLLSSGAVGGEPATQNHGHWAFRKPVRPQLPSVRDRAWVSTAPDVFVLARLEQAGLQPTSAAGRATLLRRVTFDLTGLPPTPEEVEDFARDPRPDAYVRVVDRLLSSPAYGERWAQHWLDVVRYADSNGYEVDGDRPHAWRYRDWVIRAFNDDMPFDRFLTEQVAGDLLSGGDPRAKEASLIATGFNRCGPVHLVGGNTDPEVNRNEVLTEMTDAIGSAFLGLTLGCARCHDHKFDPISQREYYGLQAFFAATQPREIDIATAAEKETHRRRAEEIRAQTAVLNKQIADLEAPYRARLSAAKHAALEPKYREALAIESKKRTADQKKLAMDAEPLIKISWDEVVDALSPADRDRRAKLRAQINKMEAHAPPPSAEAWAVKDTTPVPPTHILKRGNPHRKGARVEAGFPEMLGQAEKGGTDRVALARWLSRPENPLTARVLVNRLWQHHFGRGLVGTPNDFGARGEAPTHPELLDWLACEFVEHGWSVKHMQRLLVLSSAYCQDSRGDPPAAHKIDPDNRLLWRQNRRRLEGEALRDHALAVSGTLNRAQGGPMVRVPLELEVYELIFTEAEPDNLWPVTPDRRQHARRSIYLFAKRNVRLPLFEAFDRPDTLTSCPVRPVSTFAPQALILMNGPFMQEQSKAFAARLLHECGPDTDRQIDRAYRLALARPPRQTERDTARAFLRDQAELLRRQHGASVSDSVDPAAAALADFCLALLNRNEFIYVR